MRSTELARFALIVSYPVITGVKSRDANHSKRVRSHAADNVPCYNEMSNSPTAIWYESLDVCVLADEDRHLGHAMRTPLGWTAYDGTHLNTTKNGFNKLGTFRDVAEAKVAVEDSSGFCRRQTGSQSARSIFAELERSRNEVQHNVFKMPVDKSEDQARYRD